MSRTDNGADAGWKFTHLAANWKKGLERYQPSSTGTVCDESISRSTRCSVSNSQRAEQPVTPVIQSGSIDTTVVNKHDGDKGWVTNKHTNVKQDSILVSNKWLSNTFSKITFGAWGKSKAGEEVMENVHASSKPALTSMPEFNFSL